MKIEAAAAVGRAVCMVQSLEFALEVCLRLVHPNRKARTLSDVPPLDGPSFQTRITILVRQLKKQGYKLEDGYEKKLSDLLERRNKLVHRSVWEYGWPEESDAVGTKRLVGFADAIVVDAMPLILQAVLMIREWQERFPESAEHVERIDHCLKAFPEGVKPLEFLETNKADGTA